MFDFQKDCGLNVIKDLVKGENNLSRIYGFILYTECDPYVVKVLRDQDFWNAFDNISGSNWPIFAVRPLQKGEMTFPKSRPGMISYMVPTWAEPMSNLKIIRDFGLKGTQDLPLFVAFMWDNDDNLNQVSIPIRGIDESSTYHSLREIIEVISQAEASILPEYKGTVNVFRNVKSELKALHFKHTLQERGKIIKEIADFCSVFVKG